MILKTIYVGNHLGQYHDWVEEHNCPLSMERGDAWWFPEIDFGHWGGAQARHPSRLISMVPEIIRSPHRKVVTVSEHLILAIQNLIRQRYHSPFEFEIYCGHSKAVMDVDGDFTYWPGDFFPERLELLR
jgi:hypothetical protein